MHRGSTVPTTPSKPKPTKDKNKIPATTFYPVPCFFHPLSNPQSTHPSFPPPSGGKKKEKEKKEKKKKSKQKPDPMQRR